MKKILMAAVALTALTATPAMAADFTVSGTVGETCSYTGGAISFSSINTGSDGLIVANQSSTSAGQTGFYCNGAGTTVELSHVALTTGAAGATPPTGFTNTIGFTPVVSVGGTEVLVGDKVAGTAFGARSGTLEVTAKNLTATAKLQAGTYSGSISLTLTPAA